MIGTAFHQALYISISLTHLKNWQKYLKGDVIYNVIITTPELNSLGINVMNILNSLDDTIATAVLKPLAVEVVYEIPDQNHAKIIA